MRILSNEPKSQCLFQLFLSDALPSSSNKLKHAIECDFYIFYFYLSGLSPDAKQSSIFEWFSSHFRSHCMKLYICTLPSRSYTFINCFYRYPRTLSRSHTHFILVLFNVSWAHWNFIFLRRLIWIDIAYRHSLYALHDVGECFGLIESRSEEDL